MSDKPDVLRAEITGYDVPEWWPELEQLRAENARLRARVAELEAQLTPIPFSERTPDRYGTFMFYSRAGWWSSAWYSDITQEIILREYTHWLPLPPAPEDK